MGDDSGVQVERQLPDQFCRGGATVDNHYLAGGDQRRCGFGDRAFGAGFQLIALGEAGNGRGNRQGAAMYPLQQPLGVEFAQIAPDSVFRQPKHFAELLGQHLAILGQFFQDDFLALAGQHGHFPLKFALHEIP